MALGDITIVEQVDAQGPLFYDRISIVGDAAYPSDGSINFEALYRAALVAAGLKKASGRTIVGLILEHDTELNTLEYDHANDKLFARVKTTGIESGVSDQSGITYFLTVISK